VRKITPGAASARCATGAPMQATSISAKLKWYAIGVLLLFAALQWHAGLFEPADLQLLDVQFNLLRRHFPASAPDVVVVGIDDATVARTPEPMALWHPHLGKAIAGIARARPLALGVDVILPDRSYDSLVTGYDRQLLKGIIEARRHAPTVFGLTIGPSGKPRRVYPPFLSAAGPDGSGYALWKLDPDGSVRRFDENFDDHFVPTLSGQLARAMKIEPGSGIIDFSRGPAFTFTALHTVLEMIDAGDQDSLSRAFAGKPVLIGSVALFEDLQMQPVELAAWDPGNRRVPGVLVHAQVLRSILGGTLIQPVPRGLVLLVTLVAAAFWLVPLRPLQALAWVIGIGTAGFAGAMLAQRAGHYFPLAGVMATGATALLGRTLAEQAANAVERLRLRRAFGAYVSPHIMEEIVGGRLSGSLGGDRRSLCVLFADIRDFTTRSETLPPEAVIALLNRYFEEVTGAIHRHDGTVDKFIGDGIMAFFGAPKILANPSAAAVAAAQEMIARLDELNRNLQSEGLAPIRIGIGLHAGDAVVGHVGSAARHEYTAIGDTVNLASRIEGLTKEAGYPLVCSETVVKALDSAAGFVNLGARPVKGHTPVIVCGWPAP